MVIHDTLRLIANEMMQSDSDGAGTGFTVEINGLEAFATGGSPMGIYLSVVNLEKENAFGAQPKHLVSGGASVDIKLPPVLLNMMVMVTSNYEEYSTALDHLNSALEYFQNNPFETPFSVLPNAIFPKGSDKLIYDWYNLDMDRLNNVWGISGSSYKPSFLFKVRAVEIRHEKNPEPSTGPAIVEIKFNETVR